MMQVIRGSYYLRPAAGARLVRLGRSRKEALAALAEWKKEQRAVKLLSADPWLAVQRSLLGSMRKRCRERGWKPLTQEDMEVLWARAGGRCEVTGIPFSLDRLTAKGKRPWAPSLDRRDCALPYTFDNCRLVCTAVNLAMNEWGEDTLMRIAKALASR